MSNFFCVGGGGRVSFVFYMVRVEVTSRCKLKMFVFLVCYLFSCVLSSSFIKSPIMNGLVTYHIPCKLFRVCV